MFDQDQNLVFGALDFKFDSAIIEIPDTSAESSLRCNASRVRTIPDALDFSLHKQPRSESCRFNRFGHTFRQTAYYPRCLSNERILSHLRGGVTRFAIPRERILYNGAEKYGREAGRRFDARVHGATTPTHVRGSVMDNCREIAPIRGVSAAAMEE